MVQPSVEHIVLGRGMIYFDRFQPGTHAGEGERYIGNTTQFSIRRETETIKRLRSVRGHIVEKDRLTTRDVLSGGFITDAITVQNASEWFGGSEVVTGLLPESQVEETFRVKKGLYYQLGRPFNPMGVINVDFLKFKVNGVDIGSAGNVFIEKGLGRIFVLDDATHIEDGDDLTVTYEWRSAPRSAFFSTKGAQVEGALRFVSMNPVGPQKHYFFPFVILSPNGELALKGSDEWQQMGFQFESRCPNPRFDQMYVREYGPGLYTQDEQAILDAGVTLEDFPYWDDQLDIIVNVSMPSHFGI